jgi:hypothetical protein
LAAVAADLAGVLGLQLVGNSTETLFAGGDYTFRVHLTEDQDTDEPFDTHCLVLDVGGPDEGAARQNALRAYHLIVATGRYQAIVLDEGVPLDSSHFPLEEW